MLTGELIDLREIRPEDIETLWIWKSNPKYYEFFYELYPITLDQHKNWISKVTQSKDEILFVVADKEGKAIGSVGFVHIDQRNGKAEWGRLLLDKERSVRGAGKEVEKLMIEYAFNHLRLNKLYCEVLASNEKVIARHKEFGFVEEGVLKQHIFKNGKYVDVVVLALYKDSL